MKRLKVVVTGPFNSGKTQYIRTISEIEVISTEKKVTATDLASIKGETTVAMDFGKVTIDGNKIYIFGTPGQEQFQIMWEVLTENMIGFIVIVDSTDKERFDDARKIIKFFAEILEEPFVVAANKQDLPEALSVEELKKELELPKDALMLPLIAKDKKSTEKVLNLLLERI